MVRELCIMMTSYDDLISVQVLLKIVAVLLKIVLKNLYKNV